MPYIDMNTAVGDLHARFKMGWAKHHLRLMNEEIDKYLKGEPKPCSVTAEDDVEAGEYVIRYNFNHPSLYIPLMAGDCISCLRSSLDHLATALTQCPGGTYYDRASFPIIGVNNEAGKQSFKRALKGVPDAAVQLIESFQPYHKGTAHKYIELWILHRLWNIDKHRRIPLLPFTFNLPLTHSSEIQPLTKRAEDNGVIRFHLTDKPYLELKQTTEISINFGDASEGIIASYKELAHIHSFICDLIDKFTCFFYVK